MSSTGPAKRPAGSKSARQAHNGAAVRHTGPASTNGAAHLPPTQAADGDTPVPGMAGLPPVQRKPDGPGEAERRFRARRRAWLAGGLALLVLLLMVEAYFLSPWTDPVAGQPARAMSSVPLAEVQPYGVNVFLHKEVDRWKKEKTLDMASDMGARWIKQQFPWAEIEYRQDPQRPYWDVKNNQSAWDKFDEIVELAEQRGLHIIARIDSAPDWARADESMPEAVRDDLRSKPKAPPSAGHLKDFADFIKTFVERYRGRVSVIQVWNEPNLEAEWATGVNAQDYVTLLGTAYVAAKSADPNVIVLAAPLATTNETLAYAGNLNEMDYLQAMYWDIEHKQRTSDQYFDAMSANVYGKDLPPEDEPSREKLNFRRVELLRKVMEQNGDADKAIWFNEYGWNASPDGCCDANNVGDPYPWGRVSAEQQAEYTVQGIEYAREHWPWAGVFTLWYLRQVGDIPATRSDYYFGLVNPDFVPGPAYRAVDRAASPVAAAGPGQWGPLSAPVQAGPRWQVHYNPDVPGGLYLSPSDPQAEDILAVNFLGTGVKLMLVPQPGTDAPAARYYVEVDGAYEGVAASLPRDDYGRAYIDVPAGGEATEIEVVHNLRADLPTGRHTLSISATPFDGETGAQAGSAGLASPLPSSQSAGLPGIGVITVEARRTYALFTALTAMLLAGIAIVGWALWRSRPQPQPAPAPKQAIEGARTQ